MFLSPGGEKFAQLMCALASHVLGKVPLRNPPLEPSPVSSTNPLVTFLKLQVLKGHLHSEFEAKIKMTNSFQEQYLQYKMLARYHIFSMHLIYYMSNCISFFTENSNQSIENYVQKR